MKYLIAVVLFLSLLVLPVAAQHPAFVTRGTDTTPATTGFSGEFTVELIRVLNAKSYISTVTFGECNVNYSAYSFRINGQRIDDHAAVIVLTTLIHHVGANGYRYDHWVSTSIRLIADDNRVGSLTPNQAVAAMIKYLEDPPNPFPATFEGGFAN